MQPIQTIIVSSGLSQPSDDQRHIIQQLHQLFLSLNVHYMADASWQAFIDEPLTPHQHQPIEHGLLITVGGDGSFLRSHVLAHELNTPILGINAGNLGFLADLSPTDAKALLPPLLLGHYQIEQRPLLTIQHEHQTFLALNECSLKYKSGQHLLTCEVFIDDQPVFLQRSDGIIVATPTGSTAYNMSAGGPIVHPQVPGIILTSICPHRLNSRPMIIPNTSTITLRARQPATLSIDGQQDYTSHQEDIIISTNHSSLRLVHPETYRYYQVIQQKLHWEVDATPRSY